MFKHITAHPWTVGRRGMQTTSSVWGYENDYGIPLVAECHGKNTPTATQRANARLISIAPQMFEILQRLTNNEEAQALVRFMEKEDADENQTA
jgi:hypothetical protein